LLTDNNQFGKDTAVESSQNTLSFASISGRKVEADFDGGRTTSDGGALLLRQAEARIKIVDRIVSALSDRRHQSYILYRPDPSARLPDCLRLRGRQ